MKFDPYKHKERYLNWKEKVIVSGIPELSETNSQLVLDYIFDMENGLNVSATNKKGARSYPRLNNLRQRLIFQMRKKKLIGKVLELNVLVIMILS